MAEFLYYARIVVVIAGCILAALTIGLIILLWIIWLSIHVGGWMGIPMH